MNNRSLLKWSFKLLLFSALILVGAVLWVNMQLKSMGGNNTSLVDASKFVRESPHVRITNVSVLSPDSSYFISNQNVVIREGIITSVSSDKDEELGFETVDGRGKFLIPGLVDAHVHLRGSKNDLLLYLANGITFVREMSGNEDHISWREEINQGAIGPRMYIASEKVNSISGIKGAFNEWTRTRINYATKKGAEKKIRRLADNGFDAVKISTEINSEMYRTTMVEAKKNDLEIVGHVPFSVDLSHIYSSGQNEIAHVEEITKSLIQEIDGMGAHNAKEFLQYLRERSDSIAVLLKENNIAVTTTIWLMESLIKQKFELSTFIKEVELQYANPAFIEGTLLNAGWLPGDNYYELSEREVATEEARNNAAIFWNTYIEAIHIMTKSLVDNDVLVMAGTDANGALVIPGFSLHDELISLTNSGMTIEQALYSATTAPGEHMGSLTGKIQSGYKADLVLLSQNPLENIEHIKSIERVFFNNFSITKDKIHDMLNEIIVKNNESRKVSIDKYL